MGDTRTALMTPGVELVAVSDIYDGRLARSKEVWGPQVFTSRDYREVLARPDVDAVIIATPDHWHQKIAIDAMNAGKDVYLEKPMIQHAEEGAAIIEAANKTKRIIQIGSQRVSSVIYEKARQLYASGAVGQLNLVEATPTAIRLWARGNTRFRPTRRRRTSTGTASSATRRNARSNRSACSAGATIRTTAPASAATCSCTFLRHPLRAELARADADSGDGRHPLLE